MLSSWVMRAPSTSPRNLPICEGESEPGEDLEPSHPGPGSLLRSRLELPLGFSLQRPLDIIKADPSAACPPSNLAPRF